MGNLWYLAVVVAVSVVGVLVVWMRSRPASSPKSSIDQFHDKMRALSPDHEPIAPRSERRGAGSDSTE